MTQVMPLIRNGVNIDGAQLVEIDRGDDWHLDDRVPATQQCGPEIYANNDLDRNHLVRRRDPIWGLRRTCRRGLGCCRPGKVARPI